MTNGHTALVAPDGVRCLLVDGGSTDTTAALVAALSRSYPERVSVLCLPRNAGKAEAVRRGLALASASAGFVGYADADFATPPSELIRLARVLQERDLDAVIGARVALAGRNIQRSPRRHYAGRVFATFASLALDRVIYDTQCGAKVFRVTRALSAALADTFDSPWLFDVELIGRLFTGTDGVPGLLPSQFAEEPLLHWEDVAGSKVTASAFVRAPFELASIWLRLRRRSGVSGR
jgi:dolichyl-phosphate beta-glucosyltransferase